MTSCEDDKSMLKVVCQWPLLKSEHQSPVSPAQLERDSNLMRAERSNECQITSQESVSLESNSSLDSNALALNVLRQSFYYFQALQAEQQRASVGDSQEVLKELQISNQGIFHAVSSQKESPHGMSEVAQKHSFDKLKTYLHGSQTLSKGSASSANTVASMNKPKSTSVSTEGGTSQDKPKAFSLGFGDLLPPPPSLPKTAQPIVTPHHISQFRANLSSSTQDISTSSAFYFSPSLRRSFVNNKNNTSTSSPYPVDTSIVDKNKPLDLSTSKKHQQSNNCERVKVNMKEHVVSSTPREEKRGRTVTPPASTYEQRLLANAGLPPIRTVPTHAESSTTPLTAQQIASITSYLQSCPSPVVQAMQYTNSPSSIDPLNHQHLQKLLLTAQEHQQVIAMSQEANSRKRSISFETIEHQRDSVSNDVYRGSPKYRFLSDGTRATPSCESPIPRHVKNASSTTNSPNSGKRYKRYAKPPYSYVSLITLAILSSPDKKLRLSQILKKISDMFPFFKGQYQGWRDSVRHNLSQNECFVKVLKNPYRPTAKGNFWTVNITTIPHELLLRQNTLVSRYIQESGFTYRKDLTEVFDFVNGDIKVDVPSHLIQGNRLIDDPATVMEVLLLEPKREEAVNQTGSSNDKVYCLGDMFPQDDSLDEDLLKQSRQIRNPNERWSTKTNKSKVNPILSKSIPQSQQQVHASQPCAQVFNGIESQKLAIHMIQNSPGSLIPSNNVLIQARKDMLAQALSRRIPGLNCLPLLQHFCNVYSLQPHENVRDASPANNSGTMDVYEECSLPVSETSDTNGEIKVDRSPEGSRRQKSLEDTTEVEDKTGMKPFAGSSNMLSINHNAAEGKSISQSPEMQNVSAKQSPAPISSVRSQSLDLSMETDSGVTSFNEEDVLMKRYLSPPYTGFHIRPIELAKSV